MEAISKDLPDYFKRYIALIDHEDVLEALKSGRKKVQQVLKEFPEARQEYRYEDGKWTPKEILVHLMDAERVFAYRAMRIARHDDTSLLGFDHNAYVAPSQATLRSWKSIVKEYKILRKSTIHLFKNFSEEAMTRLGKVEDVSVAAHDLGALICGHEIHHMQVLKERYG